jgi:hypothetical protein
MDSIYFDSRMSDDVRRSRVFEGQLFVFSPNRSSLALCDLAHRLIEEALGGLDVQRAQYHFAVEEYAAILSKLKPRFTHHPEAKECIRGILQVLGCDLTKTYFDVPKMRSSTSDGYLTTGIAYAWHPHRDTWYASPQCQINWWIPIYEIDRDDGLAFHPRYWKQPIKNNSAIFNYYVWNQHRHTAAQHIKEDTRPLSRPTEPVEMEPQIRPICPRGGIIMFAGAQLHSTVPNNSGRTRFSFDFRTVHLDDLAEKKGSPNIDSEATGTAIRDFLRAADLARVPEEIVALYSDGTESAGELIYQPVNP